MSFSETEKASSQPSWKMAVISTLAFLVVVFVIEVAARVLLRPLATDDWSRFALKSLLSGSVTLLCFGFFFAHVYDRSQAGVEFAARSFKYFGWSALIGLFESLITLVLTIFGGASIRHDVSLEGIVNAMGVAFGGSVFEEVLFRGLLLQLLLHFFRVGWAILVVALLFTLAHVDGRSGLALVTVFIAGGVAFSLAFVAFRNLWVPIGLRFGGNALTMFWSGLPGYAAGYFKFSGTQRAIEFAQLTAAILLLIGAYLAYLWRRQADDSDVEIETVGASPESEQRPD
jgi:membrane protease YdiL (CAAX protease family)